MGDARLRTRLPPGARLYIGGRGRLLISRSFLNTRKLLLFSLLLATFLTLLLSPATFHKLRQHRTFRLSSFLGISIRLAAESYSTEIPVKWTEVASLLQSLKVKEAHQGLKIGLVNFNKREEVREWEEFVGDQGVSFPFPFEHVHNDLQWTDLYPEWIDEEQSKCPHIPMPHVIMQQGTMMSLDLVVVKVPYRHSCRSRDVPRLHVELAGAHVAFNTEATHILVLDACRPLPNLFGCSQLVANATNVWLFKVDLPSLMKKLALPVGSCELAVPLGDGLRLSSKKSRSSEAYATVLHSSQFYLCGAIAVAQSIRLTGSTRDLVTLVDEGVPSEHCKALELAGWKVVRIQRILNPKAKNSTYNRWNYTKFRLWQLTTYRKIIFIDADTLVLRNIDFLFELPEISAAGNDGTLFNSGVMVIEPSNCTFQLLMDQINEIESYNGGDQGYLNEIFTWWHRIPGRMNFLKHFPPYGAGFTVKEKTRLFGADPPELYVVHYLGLKPWVCFRDYDCNWCVMDQQIYASAAAHALWWKVYDSMPHNLQQFCPVRTSREVDRLQAQSGSFPDEEWQRNTTHQQLHNCNSEISYWTDLNYVDGQNDTSFD